MMPNGFLLSLARGAAVLVAIAPLVSIHAQTAPNRPPLLWTHKQHSDRINSIAFSPDETTIATGSSDRLVRVWRVTDGEVLATFNAETPPLFENSITSVAFSPDGTRLAGASHRGLRIWSIPDGELIEHIEEAHDDWIISLAFSPDGIRLASASFDGNVKLWNPENWSLSRTLTGSTAQARSVAFSPDGVVLASGMGNSLIHLWEMPEAAPLETLLGHGAHGNTNVLSADVQALVFSADGRVLASGSQDHTIRLWTVPDGRPHGILRGHGYFVYSLAFSKDAALLLSAGADNTLRVWHVSDGSLVWTFDEETTDITTVATAGDDTIVFGRADGTLLAGQIPPLLSRVTRASPAGMAFRLYGRPGQSYLVQRSDDLIEWTSISTNTLPRRVSKLSFETEGAAGFFRVVQAPPGAPPNATKIGLPFMPDPRHLPRLASDQE